MKDVFPPSCLPSFLEDWIDNISNFLCVQAHVACQISMRALGCIWLVLGLISWIRIQSWGTPPQHLYLLGCEVNEHEEEPVENKNPGAPTIMKDVALVKDKGKGKRMASLVSTRSFTKASVQRTAAQATTIVGSPTATPTNPTWNHVLTLSHRVPPYPLCRARGRSSHWIYAQFLWRSHFFSLVEIVDIRELIEDLMRSKLLPLAYRRIQ